MARKLWFRAGGWGWTPNSWEGWLVTLAAIVAVLVTICFLTGEKPGWRWGERDHHKR